MDGSLLIHAYNEFLIMIVLNVTGIALDLEIGKFLELIQDLGIVFKVKGGHVGAKKPTDASRCRGLELIFGEGRVQAADLFQERITEEGICGKLVTCIPAGV